MGGKKSDYKKEEGAKVEVCLCEGYPYPNALVVFLSLSDFMAAKNWSSPE
jgi:hypothetical protein